MGRFLVDAPDDHCDHLLTLKDKEKRISRASVVKLLIKGVFGLAKDCNIIMFDKESIRVIRGYNLIIEAGAVSENNDIEKLSIGIEFDGKSVIHSQKFINRVGDCNV